MVAGGLPDSGRQPGVVRAWVPMVDGPVRPLLQEVCFPEGRTVYLRGGNDLVPATRWRTWAFLLDSRPPQHFGLTPPPPTVAVAVTPVGTPNTGGAPGPGPGCAPHGGPQAHGRPAPGQQARGVRQEAGRTAVRPHLGGHAPLPLTGPPSRAPSFRGRPGRRQQLPTPGQCLAPRMVRRTRGAALSRNVRPGCRMEAVPTRSIPPVSTRTPWALRSVLRLPPHRPRSPT